MFVVLLEFFAERLDVRCGGVRGEVAHLCADDGGVFDDFLGQRVCGGDEFGGLFGEGVVFGLVALVLDAVEVGSGIFDGLAGVGEFSGEPVESFARGFVGGGGGCVGAGGGAGGGDADGSASAVFSARVVGACGHRACLSGEADAVAGTVFADVFDGEFVDVSSGGGVRHVELFDVSAEVVGVVGGVGGVDVVGVTVAVEVGELLVELVEFGERGAAVGLLRAEGGGRSLRGAGGWWGCVGSDDGGGLGDADDPAEAVSTVGGNGSRAHMVELRAQVLSVRSAFRVSVCRPARWGMSDLLLAGWVVRALVFEALSEVLPDGDAVAVREAAERVADRLVDAGVAADDGGEDVPSVGELTGWSPGDVIVDGSGADPRVLREAKSDGDGWWLEDGTGLSCSAIVTGGWVSTSELAAKAARFEMMFDEGVTVREAEAMIHDGELRFGMMSDGPVSHATTKMLSALMLNVLYGEERVEPENYRSCTLELGPAGFVEPGFTVHLEVVKRGHRSSHDFRCELEARVGQLEAQLEARS